VILAPASVICGAGLPVAAPEKTGCVFCAIGTAGKICTLAEACFHYI
jgi:hypothetical protein